MVGQCCQATLMYNFLLWRPAGLCACRPVCATAEAPSTILQCNSSLVPVLLIRAVAFILMGWISCNSKICHQQFSKGLCHLHACRWWNRWQYQISYLQQQNPIGFLSPFRFTQVKIYLWPTERQGFSYDYCTVCLF